jgi:hypothetical protein
MNNGNNNVSLNLWAKTNKNGEIQRNSKGRPRLTKTKQTKQTNYIKVTVTKKNGKMVVKNNKEVNISNNKRFKLINNTKVISQKRPTKKKKPSKSKRTSKKKLTQNQLNKINERKQTKAVKYIMKQNDIKKIEKPLLLLLRIAKRHKIDLKELLGQNINDIKEKMGIKVNLNTKAQEIKNKYKIRKKQKVKNKLNKKNNVSGIN